jgi:nucleotide-binding universal stress UspA family protein
MKTKARPIMAAAPEALHLDALPCLDRILVATDFSPLSRAALDAGLALARKCARSSVTVVHVVDSMSYLHVAGPGGAFNSNLDKLVRTAQRNLDRLRQTLGARGHFESRLICGKPARAICELARDEHFDLIIVASHGLTGFNRKLIGSVTEQVIQNSEVSVLVVKPRGCQIDHTEEIPSLFPMRHILVGYDHRKGALRALEMARKLARQGEGEITLVHAIEPSRFWGFSPPHEGRTSVEECISEALKRLRTIQALEGHGIKIIAKAGHPWDVISQCADELASDLVVIGHHDHTRWGHSFVGSTAQRVVRLASRSVLAVKW